MYDYRAVAKYQSRLAQDFRCQSAHESEEAALRRDKVFSKSWPLDRAKTCSPLDDRPVRYSAVHRWPPAPLKPLTARPSRAESSLGGRLPPIDHALRECPTRVPGVHFGLRAQ